MIDALSGFLRIEAGRPLIYGGSDCMLLPADWAVALGHPDPAAPWRGTYSDASAARDILHAHGGAVGLMTAALSAASARKETNAVRGDLGVVVVEGPDGRAEVGAICTGMRWAVRGRRGLWIGKAEALAIWRLMEG